MTTHKCPLCGAQQAPLKLPKVRIRRARRAANAKLTDAEAWEILQLHYHDRMSARAIAASGLYPVGRSQIGRILSGEHFHFKDFPYSLLA